MESVKELLVTAILSLQGEKLETVLKNLANIGVESLSDPSFVDAERDFCGILRPIHAHKVANFLTAFRQSSGELLFYCVQCSYFNLLIFLVQIATTYFFKLVNTQVFLPPLNCSLILLDNTLSTF